MDYNALKESFINYYYSLYDSNRDGLSNLYAEKSMCTMNGTSAQGSSSIVAALKTLPATKHTINTKDALAVPTNNGAFVLVTGQITLPDNTKFSFAESFDIQPTPGSSSYFVFNQIFRIVQSRK